MVLSLAKWIGGALAGWLLGHTFSNVVGPFTERPFAWIKSKCRGLALRLHLAVPEEGLGAYAMA